MEGGFRTESISEARIFLHAVYYVLKDILKCIDGQLNPLSLEL